MQEEQSIINVKRQEWRVEIRKKQLQDYFQKRRMELLQEDQKEVMWSLSEEEKIGKIVEHINKFCCLQLRNLVRDIVTMDPTLAIFYHLTSFNPQSPPIFFKEIISEVLRGYRQRPIHPEFYLDKQFTSQEKSTLGKIWQRMEGLWLGESKNYISVLSGIKRVDNMSLLIRKDIILFLSIMLNIMLIFQKLAGILGIPLTRQSIVGEDTLFRYEIQTTLTILNNILSGDDELLAPFVNEFLDYNGCSIECQGLFYNLFLIKHVPSDVRVKIFQYYANMIDNQRRYMLENYPAVTNTLYAALKCCPQFKNKHEKESFLVVGQRLIKFFASLLGVINMRYQSFICNEDYNFLNHMCWILYHLGTQSLMGNIMEAKNIHTFILNHLNYTKIAEQLQITSFCLKILDNATKDSYSIHFFLNQEPRFIIKSLILFGKYLSIDYKTLSDEETDVLDSLLYLLSNVSNIAKVAAIFLKEGIFHKIGAIYFRMNGHSLKAKNIRQSCQIIYLNLLTHLKTSYDENLQIFYSHLFDNNATYSMLINILKFTPERKEIVYCALRYLSYIAYSCDTVSQFPLVKDMLLSEMLTSRLAELQNCEIADISQKATYVIKTIQGIKYVQQATGHSQSEYYDEQQLI